MRAVHVLFRFCQDQINEVALATTILDIVCLLPFLNPFPLEANIVLQSLLVVLAGALSWLLLLVHHKTSFILPRTLFVLLVLYVAGAMISLLVQHSPVNILGSRYLQLGVLPLVACVGCGLAMRSISTNKLLTWLYCSSVIVAVVSLATIHPPGIIGRFGGVFHQADILGVWCGCGVVLGIAMWQLYPRFYRLLIMSELTLLAVVLLTETRAIIALLCIVGLIIIMRSNIPTPKKAAVIFCAGVLVVLLGFVFEHGHYHIFDRHDASASVSYRMDLQRFALKASIRHPYFGYGAGNVSQALACPTLTAAALQKTCQSGFYFNSSHNIYIDRILAFGFIVGAAYVCIVIFAVYHGLLSTGADRYFGYAALIIALYYLSNVTSTPVELLFWIFLLRPFDKQGLGNDS